MHDVVVVGAGPGGSAAAHFLARRGLDVLLLDKFDFPRDKTCGDGLTPRALGVLGEMGLLPELARVGRRIEGFEVVAPNGHATGGGMPGAPGHALAVPRYRLDALVRERALRSGARFQGPVTVATLEAGERGVAAVGERQGRALRVAARVAVVATGASTGLLVRAGLLRRPPPAMLAARAYFEGLADPGDRFQLRFDGVPLPGYGWVFPVSASAANVGVGYLPARAGPTTTSRAAFDRFVGQPALRRRLASAHQAGPLRGFPIRVDFPAAPTTGDRALLVGEAAGLVNPLTGEGIDYALESGRLAAEHLAAAFEAGDLSRARLEAYDRLLRQRFERLFRFCRQVRDWYPKGPLLNVLVGTANRRPELRLLLAEIVLGSQEASDRGLVSGLLKLARPW